MQRRRKGLSKSEAELCRMTWIDTIDLPTYQASAVDQAAVGHYAGRRAKWTVHLMVLKGSEGRMAVASSQSALTIVKLPDELVKNVEAAARRST